MIKRLKILLFIGIIIGIIFFLSRNKSVPGPITYGVSFSKFHSDELGLDWREVYSAILQDLQVKNFRFSAHWPMIEPEKDKFNFEELDFQVKEAQKVGASVILALGRRLPGWPECHEPAWVKNFDKDKKQEEILNYLEAVTQHYKGFNNIKYWQVENEPFLTFFSKENCGELDVDFLDKEIKFVKELDPTRPIIVTDSGEFGTWYKAYQRGDIFGTSMYLYVWWRNFIGPLRYPITPGFFRLKHNLVRSIYGKKTAMVIELSAEPWLLKPIVDTPIETQLQRMGMDKFNEVIDFSSKTGFDTLYFWGAEWWYWLKLHGHPELWIRAKEIFN